MTESNNRIMTTRELAEYIKLNEKTVIKMAQNGELPGVKIGAQWRFHLSAIDRYIQNDVVHASNGELNMLINTAQHIIPLSRLADESLIELDLSAKNKNQVIHELANIAHRSGRTPTAEGLYIQLKTREKMLSTAIGQGVAIPHARMPLPELFNKPNIIMARSISGVDFDAPDKKKVHLFIMPCAPNEFVHVRLLAKISKLLHAPNIIGKFMDAKAKEDIIQLLLEFERETVFPQNISI